MPVYELALITRMFKRPDAIGLVKRISESMWKHRAFIRDIQFLGSRTMPFKFVVHDEYHWRGMHWLITFDFPVASLRDFREELARDGDLLRIFLTKAVPNEETIEEKTECKLEEESLPPAYREDVRNLIAHGKPLVKSRQL